MKVLRRRSLVAVWLIVTCVITLIHAYRVIVALEPPGFFIDSTEWQHMLIIVPIFNLPDVISAFLYILLILHEPLSENQEADESLVGGDNDYYFDGIYVGAEADQSVNPVDVPIPVLNAEFGVFQDLPDLPGTLSDHQDTKRLAKEPRRVLEETGITSSPLLQSQGTLADIEVVPVPPTSEMPSVPPQSAVNLSPLHQPQEQSRDDQEQHPNVSEVSSPPIPLSQMQQHDEEEEHNNAIKECGLRALKVHIVTSHLEFLFFPVLVLLLPQGPIRMITLTLLLIFGAFWLPMIMVVYNVGKIRKGSEVVLEWLGNRARLFLSRITS